MEIVLKDGLIQRNFLTPTSQRRMEEIRKILKRHKKPLSKPQLANLAGISTRWMGEFIEHMHAPVEQGGTGELYITHYEHNPKGHKTPCYQLKTSPLQQDAAKYWLVPEGENEGSDND